MLAVTLGHLEATRTLLKFNCNGNVENADGWTGMYMHIEYLKITMMAKKK